MVLPKLTQPTMGLLKLLGSSLDDKNKDDETVCTEEAQASRASSLAKSNHSDRPYNKEDEEDDDDASFAADEDFENEAEVMMELEEEEIPKPTLRLSRTRSFGSRSRLNRNGSFNTGSGEGSSAKSTRRPMRRSKTFDGEAVSGRMLARSRTDNRSSKSLQDEEEERGSDAESPAPRPSIRPRRPLRRSMSTDGSRKLPVRTLSRSKSGSRELPVRTLSRSKSGSRTKIQRQNSRQLLDELAEKEDALAKKEKELAEKDAIIAALAQEKIQEKAKTKKPAQRTASTTKRRPMRRQASKSCPELVLAKKMGIPSPQDEGDSSPQNSRWKSRADARPRPIRRSLSGFEDGPVGQGMSLTRLATKQRMARREESARILHQHMSSGGLKGDEKVVPSIEPSTESMESSMNLNGLIGDEKVKNMERSSSSGLLDDPDQLKRMARRAESARFLERQLERSKVAAEAC